MFGRNKSSQPTPKDGANAPETETEGASADSAPVTGGVGQATMDFDPKTAQGFTPGQGTPSFQPESKPASAPFTPSSSMAAPPLKPFAQRGTQMPSRPTQTPYKQPDMPTRRPLDIHAPRRPDANAGDGKTLTVGREIQLSGEISACDHLVVEGKVQANLSNARVLEVAESGEFHGKVTIEDADISGLFEGEMTVTRLLTIRPSGRVTGTVRYEALVIEEGGKIKGDVSPTEDDGSFDSAAS